MGKPYFKHGEQVWVRSSLCCEGFRRAEIIEVISGGDWYLIKEEVINPYKVPDSTLYKLHDWSGMLGEFDNAIESLQEKKQEFEKVLTANTS